MNPCKMELRRSSTTPKDQELLRPVHEDSQDCRIFLIPLPVFLSVAHSIFRLLFGFVLSLSVESENHRFGWTLSTGCGCLPCHMNYGAPKATRTRPFWSLFFGGGRQMKSKKWMICQNSKHISNSWNIQWVIFKHNIFSSWALRQKMASFNNFKQWHLERIASMPRHTDDAASALATARSSGDATQCQGEVTEKDLTRGKSWAKIATPEV